LIDWGVIGPAKADAAMETVAMTLATETVVLNILVLLSAKDFAEEETARRYLNGSGTRRYRIFMFSQGRRDCGGGG
jgi:hypothetical protein